MVGLQRLATYKMYIIISHTYAPYKNSVIINCTNMEGAIMSYILTVIGLKVIDRVLEIAAPEVEKFIADEIKKSLAIVGVLIDKHLQLEHDEKTKAHGDSDDG